MKIALVRLSSLGDIILCMASLQLVRRHIPDCQITWVADRRFADILENQPDIQRVISLDLKGLKKRPSISGLSAAYRDLGSAGPFDAVIDLHGMIKSAITAKIMGSETFGFDRRVIKEPLGSLFYRQTYNVPLEMRATCRYASLVMQSLGLAFQESDMSSIQPFLFAKHDDFNTTNEFFSPERRNIIIVPGTSAANKNYPPDRFARLATLLGENILICHGNQKEYETAAAISEQACNVRILPRLNLGQLTAAISRADLVIGGDSGPTHIAWACGVPSITLFGATPVCFPTTDINLAIKSVTAVNLRKPDTSDLSIRTIPESAIIELSSKLLKRTTGKAV